jgi:hypothetical protein
LIVEQDYGHAARTLARLLGQLALQLGEELYHILHVPSAAPPTPHRRERVFPAQVEGLCHEPAHLRVSPGPAGRVA